MGDDVFVPHVDLPFRFSGAALAVAEQDTIEDITNCVRAILLYRIGQRIELPEFGIEDPTFSRGDPDISRITAAVVRWEPRATPEIVAAAMDDLTSGVAVNVQAQEGAADV